MDAVHEDAHAFEALVKEENVELATNAMGYVCSFITPKIEQRRFHTDFFVVAVDDADVKIDAGETTDFRWLTPADAIEDNKRGNMRFLPPQFFVLSVLATFERARDVASYFLARPTSQEPVPILPHAVELSEKEIVLAYPGGARFPAPHRTLTPRARRRGAPSVPGQGGAQAPHARQDAHGRGRRLFARVQPGRRRAYQ